MKKVIYCLIFLFSLNFYARSQSQPRASATGEFIIPPRYEFESYNEQGNRYYIHINLVVNTEDSFIKEFLKDGNVEIFYINSAGNTYALLALGNIVPSITIMNSSYTNEGITRTVKPTGMLLSCEVSEFSYNQIRSNVDNFDLRLKYKNSQGYYVECSTIYFFVPKP
jgi:hypothetical protein